MGDNQNMKVDISTNGRELRQKGYDERHRFWSAKSIEQLSFANNLILTLSLAALGFFFNQNSQLCSYKKLYITIILICCLSIFLGILSALSRLYDFRFSRKITLIRKIYFDRFCTFKEFKFGKLPSHTPIESNVSSGITSLIINVLSCIFEIIRVYIYGTKSLTVPAKEINVKVEDDRFREEFKSLLDLSDSISSCTWVLFNSQVLFFCISVILYSTFRLLSIGE